ncbi:MAG: type IV-A pilus assembly ATPase PilB, partial [Pseudomonadota bacterium]
MNDNALSATSRIARSANVGLPEKLVQDGLLAEAAMADAQRGAKEARQSLVSYLVEKNIVQAREIAITAASMFGVPLLDIDSVQVDLDTIKLVNDKLLQKHRILPLMKRGRRLFVAVSDPTNLHGIDEIRF